MGRLSWLCFFLNIVNIFGQDDLTLPQCITNEECGEQLSCVDLKCQDPCPGICRNNATCEVRNHVAYCACNPGLSGSPFTGCYQDAAVPAAPAQQCTPCAPCQTSAPAGVQGAGRCKKDYLVVSEDLKWNEAASACKKLGRELVTLHDEEEWENVKRAILLAGPPAHYWLGGSNLYDDKWVWISDWTPFTFTRWDEGEPNNGGNNQHCPYIKKDNRLWDDWDCYSGVSHYICEKCID